MLTFGIGACLTTYGSVGMLRCMVHLKDLYNDKSKRFSFVNRETKTPINYFNTGVSFIKVFGQTQNGYVLLGKRLLTAASDIPANRQYCGYYTTIKYLNFYPDYAKFVNDTGITFETDVMLPVRLEYETDDRLMFIHDNIADKGFFHTSSSRYTAMVRASFSARIPLTFVSFIVGILVMAWYLFMNGGLSPREYHHMENIVPGRN